MDDNKKLNEENEKENFFDEKFSFEQMNKDQNAAKNAENAVANEKKEKSALREVAEWVACIGIAIAVALILKTYVMTIAVVDGPSMENTLHDAERLVTWKLGYEPERNDVIIFQPPRSTKENPVYYVKRIIATEFDEVVIDYNQNAVFVNGEKIEEDYIKDEVMLPHGSGIVNGELKVTVPEGYIFVLGDNRNNSEDSRSVNVGCIAEDKVEGKVLFRFWPLNKIGTVD